MTSLTQTAITTRKIIRYGIFAVVAIIIARMVIIAGIKVYKKVFPPPPAPPTVTFGKLPKITFPTSNSLQNVTFTLETADGEFPKLTTQAKVFFMPQPSSNLLSLSTAKEKAGGMGFNQEGQEISQTTYRFPHRTAPATLEMNIISGTFSIGYDLVTDPSPLKERAPIPEIAASAVRSFLSTANILPADLTGPTTHEFIKLQDGKLVAALSLSEANIVKVNLFRKNYDNLSVLTPNPNTANVWFYISGIKGDGKEIIAGEFHYFPVDETQSSTYPIISTDNAWSELSKQQVYIARTGPHKEGDNIKIRKIYLAYYDPNEVSEFLQPIIVLDEGTENGFMAYIPAVTSDYYGE